MPPLSKSRDKPSMTSINLIPLRMTFSKDVILGEEDAKRIGVQADAVRCKSMIKLVIHALNSFDALNDSASFEGTANLLNYYDPVVALVNSFIVH